MFEFFNNILKLWQGSSKSQRGGLIAFFICLILAVGVYERWTAGFRLSKLERSAEVLTAVSQVPSTSTNDVASIAQSITSQLADVVGVDNGVVKRRSLISRFLVGLVSWFLLGLAFVPNAIRKDRSELTAAYGAWGFGVFFSVLAMFLPQGHWPWPHLLVYPILSLIIFMGFVMAISASSSKKTKIETTEPEVGQVSPEAAPSAAPDEPST